METRQFASNLLTYYLKGSVEKNGNMIDVSMPNSILTFIPLGCKSDSVPLSQISSVGTDFYVDVKNLLVGVILFLFGLGNLGNIAEFADVLVVLVLLAIGAAEVINSIHTKLKIRTTSGEVVGKTSVKVDKKGRVKKNEGIDFVIFDKAVAEAIAADLKVLVNQRVDDTNVRVHTDKQIENANQNNAALLDAINSLKE